MLVHSFSAEDAWLDDYQAFAQQIELAYLRDVETEQLLAKPSTETLIE